MAKSRNTMLFVVAGGTQWDDALRIAAVTTTPCLLLDLHTMEVCGPPPSGTPYTGTHWPRQGPIAIRALLARLRRHLPDVGVVVLGQDAGRLQRITARAARGAGVPVAVVPDGALFDAVATLPPRERIEETLLAYAQLTAGSPLQFGSTQPDLWCAWADGWKPLLQRFSPRGTVEVTGSPRGSQLLELPVPSDPPARVLICSQPTWVHPFPPSGTAGPTWYQWIERIVRTAPQGAVSVRLHPRERDIIGTLGLGPETAAAVSPPMRLGDDLGRVDAVVAPFSTVLIEAAAARRRVISVVPEPACLPVRELSPAMADPALHVALTSELADYDALLTAIVARGAIGRWADRYAWLDPDAPEKCADALQRSMAMLTVS